MTPTGILIKRLLTHMDNNEITNDKAVEPVYKGIDGMVVCTNLLSDEIKEKVSLLPIPNVRFINMLDDKYSQAMFYNGMVVVLYEDENQYRKYNATIINSTYLFKSAQLRIHHVLHVVKNDSGKYVVIHWRCSAGDQKIEEQPHIENAIQTLFKIIEDDNGPDSKKKRTS